MVQRSPNVPPDKLRQCAVKVTLATLVLALWVTAWPAENPPPVLRISGDLIPLDNSLTPTTAPETVLNVYYAALPADLEEQAGRLRRELARLIMDYEFALSAADTAEVNNLVSDIALCWARIRTLHASKFAPAAAQQLRAAYGELYPSLASGQNPP